MPGYLTNGPQPLEILRVTTSKDLPVIFRPVKDEDSEQWSLELPSVSDVDNFSKGSSYYQTRDIDTESPKQSTF